MEVRTCTGDCLIFRTLSSCAAELVAAVDDRHPLPRCRRACWPNRRRCPPRRRSGRACPRRRTGPSRSNTARALRTASALGSGSVLAWNAPTPAAMMTARAWWVALSVVTRRHAFGRLTRVLGPARRGRRWGGTAWLGRSALSEVLCEHRGEAGDVVDQLLGVEGRELPPRISRESITLVRICRRPA